MTFPPPERQMDNVTSLVRLASDRHRELLEALGRLRSSHGSRLSVDAPHGEMPFSDVTLAQPAPSLFDELVAAVSTGSLDLAKHPGALPPRSRFRVRMVPVGRPHRATKRNYDYFEELNARIAANGDRGDVRAAG
jgi:hypothetical protein